MSPSSQKVFKRTILAAILLSLIPSALAPYLPLIFSNLRVMITSQSASFWLYHSLVIIILTVLMFPGLFFLGRLLPHTFNLIEKNERDYGKKCGIIYFLNTAGTFFGSLFFAYLAFIVTDLPLILKFLYLMIGVSSVYFLLDGKKLIKPGSVVAAILIFLVLPWPRTWHVNGLFRKRKLDQKIHLKCLSNDSAVCRSGRSQIQRNNRRSEHNRRCS